MPWESTGIISIMQSQTTIIRDQITKIAMINFVKHITYYFETFHMIQLNKEGCEIFRCILLNTERANKSY